MWEWGDVTRTVVASSQPSPGAGVTIPSPESERQQLVAVAFRLVTSAAVANRTVIVSVTDGSSVNILSKVASAVQAAGVTVDYCFAAHNGAAVASTGLGVTDGICPLPLAEGDSIVIAVNLIDVADQISRVRVTLLQAPVRPDDR